VKTSAQGSIKNYLRAVAEKSLEIASAIYQQHLNGEYTEAESKKKIHDILLDQTIGDTGYIYLRYDHAAYDRKYVSEKNKKDSFGHPDYSKGRPINNFVNIGDILTL
jgi:hypothetical protein